MPVYNNKWGGKRFLFARNGWVITNGIPFWLVGEFTTHFSLIILVGDWDLHWGGNRDFGKAPGHLASLLFGGAVFSLLQRDTKRNPVILEVL